MSIKPWLLIRVWPSLGSPEPASQRYDRSVRSEEEQGRQGNGCPDDGLTPLPVDHSAVMNGPGEAFTVLSGP